MTSATSSGWLHSTPARVAVFNPGGDTKLANMVISGASGVKYTFEVYLSDTKWKEIGAVYVVSKRTEKSGGGGDHTYIYVGQTDNLSKRHSDHHKTECFKRHGANCLCVHVEKDENKRLEIEADLLDAWDWPCNE